MTITHAVGMQMVSIRWLPCELGLPPSAVTRVAGTPREAAVVGVGINMYTPTPSQALHTHHHLRIIRLYGDVFS